MSNHFQFLMSLTTTNDVGININDDAYTKITATAAASAAANLHCIVPQFSIAIEA